jgi:hypothetical protein
MRKLTDGHDRILDDLRAQLEDELDEDSSWPDIVEDAMNSAWDGLLKAQPAEADDA